MASPFFLKKKTSFRSPPPPSNWNNNNLDQRNVPALGRIGDPDDIIGSVLVEKSKVFTFFF